MDASGHREGVLGGLPGQSLSDGVRERGARGEPHRARSRLAPGVPGAVEEVDWPVKPPLPDHLIWLALWRVRRGGVSKLGECYLDGGQPLGVLLAVPAAASALAGTPAAVRHYCGPATAGHLRVQLCRAARRVPGRPPFEHPFVPAPGGQSAHLE